MKVGIVQFDCCFGEVTKNIEKAIRMMCQHQADLWVLPELFNTGYQFTSKKEAYDLAEPVPEGPTTKALIETASAYKTTLIAGIAERDQEKIYNASVLVTPKGFVAVYRKLHLFYKETKWFTPGDLPLQVVPVGYKSPKGGHMTVRVGMMICFDWIFPETSRTLALLGADIIAHPSNLVLPNCPDAMVTRCLENRLFTITSNRTGVESRDGETLTYIGKSQIVNPGGKVLYRAGTQDETAHVVVIDPKAARNKRLNPYNNLFKDRREALYQQRLVD